MYINVFLNLGYYKIAEKRGKTLYGNRVFTLVLNLINNKYLWC